MRSALVFVLAAGALAMVGCTPKEATPAEGTMRETDSSSTSSEESTPPVTSSAVPKDSAKPNTTDTDAATSKDSGATEKTAVPVRKTGTTVVAYRDDKGELVCPVMGTVIESEDKAIGFQDYKGVRYYFCCDDCPKLFKKDPEPWIKKK